MSEAELDLASIAEKVLQLEDQQVMLKKYLAKLKRQLEVQEQRFNERPEPQLLERLMAEIATLQQSLELGNEDMSVISADSIELDSNTEKTDCQYQLVRDRANSRAVLIEALSLARKRLIVVCPWLNCDSINDELLQKFRDCLNRGCAIDIGWGYLEDGQKIGNGWRYNALADLQELESEYPDLFCLYLLGTNEKYLVCDSSFAMLGSHNFLTSSDRSAEKELGIRTTNCQIIEELIEGFDSSKVLTKEEIERRFAASSDALDRADYLEGLAGYAVEIDVALADSDDDSEDESESSLEPVVTVEEFWERYSQGDRDFTGINLAGANLTGKNLGSDVNLSKANLKQANLRGVNWQNIDLSGAILKGADMRDGSFYSTNFSKDNLCGVNLDSAKLSAANLNQTNLINANLARADLSGVNLNQANLSRANLAQANLSNANLERSNLINASFAQATLSSVNLNHANLSKANLNQANLQFAKLEKAKLSEASLRGAKLYNANFTEANLRGAYLSGAHLSKGCVPPKFTTANLAEANLNGLYLRNTDLRNADLTNAKLTNRLIPTPTTWMIYGHRRIERICSGLTFKTLATASFVTNLASGFICLASEYCLAIMVNAPGLIMVIAPV